jgi:hypothetical protein
MARVLQTHKILNRLNVHIFSIKTVNINRTSIVSVSFTDRILRYQPPLQIRNLGIVQPSKRCSTPFRKAWTAVSVPVYATTLRNVYTSVVDGIWGFALLLPIHTCSLASAFYLSFGVNAVVHRYQHSIFLPHIYFQCLPLLL